MKVKVCIHCGSAHIQQDAWVHLNKPTDIQTFDDLYCENCEFSCKTKEVEVPDDFDIYNDLY
jgi:transcription elongation factor Elf1